MTRRPLLAHSLAILALLAAAPVHAADANAEIQLQRALDTTIDLTLDKEELSKGFEKIAATAKISIQVDMACYDALPYGQTTKVSATFRSSPVRAAINEILAPLGLEQSVSGNTLLIRPSRALTYIGRRADWDELKLLQSLRTEDLPKIDLDWTSDLRTLLGRPQLMVKMEAVDAGAQEKAMAQVRSVLPCTVAKALDTYAAATNQIWTVQGQDVQVMPMKKWIAGQLERPIVIHFTNAPLANVIAEISSLSRIHFRPEPGLYMAVPKVYVDSPGSTVQATLDSLSGMVGIAYEVRDDGIYLRRAGVPGMPATPATTPAANTDPIVGRFAVPMGKDNISFDFFLRESDLPPEINELRKKRVDEVTAALRQSLGMVPPPSPPSPSSFPSSPAPSTSPSIPPAAATHPAATTTAPAAKK